MATRILIPIKNLSDGKFRLAAALDRAATVAEFGYPGFAAGHWGGFFAPAGIQKSPFR